jgi:hypothetical protein
MSMDCYIMDMETAKRPRHNGMRHKIRLPQGATSLIELVRYGMSGDYASGVQAAKAIGLHRDTYNLTRKLLLLKARLVLNEAEEKAANRALAILNDDLMFRPAAKIAAPILDKHWATNTRYGEYREQDHRSRIALKTRKRLENTLFAIREACTNNDELQLPLGLSRPEKKEIENSLNESICALEQLKQRLMGEQSD